MHILWKEFLFIALFMARPAYAISMFIPLGDLPGGAYFSTAMGVSDDGQVVTGGSSSNVGNQFEAFRWTSSTGMVGLGVVSPNEPRSIGSGISADGSTIVGYSGTPGSQSMRYTDTLGMEGIGDIPGGLFGSYARGVSGDGSIIVGMGRSDIGGIEAYRWTESGGFESLGDLPGGEHASEANAISRDGQFIVGWGTTDVTREAFRWTESGGFERLGNIIPNTTNYSIANDVSDDGRFIVGQGKAEAGGEGFLWEEGVGMIGLGDLPGGQHSGVAGAISGNGKIVGGSSFTDLGREAFVWDYGHGIKRLADILINDFNLDLAGFLPGHVVDMSIDGRFLVGYGINQHGNTEGWLAQLDRPVLVPEPPIIGMYLIGLVGLAALVFCCRSRSTLANSGFRIV